MAHDPYFHCPSAAHDRIDLRFEFVEPVEIRAEVMMVASRVKLHSEFPKTVQDPRRNKLANRHNSDCHRTLL
jgi:hypothetical protein